MASGLGLFDEPLGCRGAHQRAARPRRAASSCFFAFAGPSQRLGQFCRVGAGGVHAGTPDPENGTILRDADGEPNGGLLEHAATLIARVVPPPDDATLAEAVRRAGEDLARLGITTVHHMAYESPDGWRMMAHAASREGYPLRVWACIDQENAEHAAAIGLATGQGGDRFMIGGAKFFADGALGSLTAWMLEPYDGTHELGMPVHGPEVLAARLPVVIDAGLTPVTHAIGDAANRAILDALEATKPLWEAKGLRPRIEHAQHLHPDDIPRFGQLGVIASLQPYHLVFDAKTHQEASTWPRGRRLRHAQPPRLRGAARFRLRHARRRPGRALGAACRLPPFGGGRRGAQQPRTALARRRRSWPTLEAQPTPSGARAVPGGCVRVSTPISRFFRTTRW